MKKTAREAIKYGTIVPVDVEEIGSTPRCSPLKTITGVLFLLGSLYTLSLNGYHKNVHHSHYSSRLG